MEKVKNWLCLLMVWLIWAAGTVYAQAAPDSFRWWYSNYTSMADAGEWYYVMAGEYLYFVDKVSLEPILLCSRLDCLHQDEENPQDCDAFCSYGGSIGFFEDHLYFVDNLITNNFYSGSDAIYQTEPDGTMHQVFIDLGDRTDYSRGDYGFFNGYYFYTLEDIVSDENNPDAIDFEMVESLYMLDLRRPDMPPVLIATWKTSKDMIIPRQLVGDNLYYLQVSTDGIRAIWRYDLRSNDKQCVLTYSEDYDFYLKDDAVYLLSPQDGILSVDPQSHERKSLFTFQSDADKGFIKSDGQYFYVSEKLDRSGDSGKETLVIDFAGQIVNRIPFPETVVIEFVTDAYLFFTSPGNLISQYVIPKADLLTPGIQPMFVKRPEYLYHNAEIGLIAMP